MPTDTWTAQTRAALAAADAVLATRFDGGEDIDRLLAARCAQVDRHVHAAWDASIDPDAPLALFAVGGYGRGELFPRSDIDLLVLAEAQAQARHTDAIAAFLALLWDAGLPVGHAVRSPGECREAAAADITVLTALMEARLLSGPDTASVQLMQAIDATRIWPPAEYFLAKREEQRRRHARFDNAAHGLEPNPKEGPGGLRDLQTLRWMGRRLLGAQDLQALTVTGMLGDDEQATLQREHRALSRLRFGLHLVAGRAEERLRFDHQKALAQRLGFRDDPELLAVELMMQGFYRSAALVQRIGERLLQRFEEQLEGESAAVALEDGFETRHGYLATAPAWPNDATTAPVLRVFDLFRVWAAHPDLRGLHSHSARALAESLPALPVWDGADTAAREAFLQLLRGPAPVTTLERMARLGVLGRWLPAFGRVSGRMQFDLFHAYTVDVHTLAVLRNVAGFATGDADPRFAIAHEVAPRLRKPELLLLAALFHDIGKGRGGDHAELGAEDARVFCLGHGLSDADAALVEWLVRRHLLMSVTAQKQDIADPDVIQRFATEVADRERLDHLYLLTCADIAGTSPKLWNSWKDRLLADLYGATRFALRRGLEHPVAAQERASETRAAAARLLVEQGMDADGIGAGFATLPAEAFLRERAEAIAWQVQALRGTDADATVACAREREHGAIEVLVAGPDRDGLFAAIVAVLDRLGLAVQQARLLDAPQARVFDTFEVLPAAAHAAGPKAIERELAAALALLDLRRVRSARRMQPRHLRHFHIPPDIQFGELPERGRTQLSLVCTDRPGLLADIARVLRDAGARVHDARIATFGA
ncbi:MAG TPA: [protein-PII] uridylyltransferase, partial [Xanthomonadaceae bacterium]|nr:[protein-PII] uridylyltransferase [Xanthomonadaceae bacterium]